MPIPCTNSPGIFSEWLELAKDPSFEPNYAVYADKNLMDPFRGNDLEIFVEVLYRKRVETVYPRYLHFPTVGYGLRCLPHVQKCTSIETEVHVPPASVHDVGI